jgi:predicted  nucleic acid-binding Zn-ribbon protein
MIKSRKHQLLIALISICTCGVILSAEPNEVKTEVKFETKSPQQARMLLRAQYKPPYGSTHYAVLFVRGDWSHDRRMPIEAILKTTAGRAMSEQQRDITSNQSINLRDNGTTISNYTYFQLYGVSEDDTKKLAEAVIEVLANKSRKLMQSCLNGIQKYQKEIPEIKKKLPEKQKQFKEAELKYMKIKDARYFSLSGSEVYKRSKELMLEMDKMLDVLEIELAGIQGKMKVLESYRRTKRLLKNNLSDDTVDKLDQMYVEQIVELRGVEARKKAALKIRNREKEFLNLFNQWSNLESEVRSLKGRLEDHEHNLRQVEEKLANQTPEMLPPKVYQNKVTIYPVK